MALYKTMMRVNTFYWNVHAGQCSFSPAFQCSSGQCISLLTAVMGFETALMAVMRGTVVSFQSILTVADSIL